MLRRIALPVFLASIFLNAESFGFNNPSQLPFLDHDAHHKILDEGDGQFKVMGPAPPRLGKQISQEERQTWKLNCTSKLTKHECAKVIDGKNTTFWSTNITSERIDVLPHNITIDLRERKTVNALAVRPLPDADLGGAVAGHRVYISTDKEDWKLVAFGTWFEDVQGELFLSRLLSNRRTDHLRRQVRWFRTTTCSILAS